MRINKGLEFWEASPAPRSPIARNWETHMSEWCRGVKHRISPDGSVDLVLTFSGMSSWSQEPSNHLL